MSNTIKLPTLAVALAFLVGCGATELKIFDYRLNTDGRHRIAHSNVVVVSATDLMDISFTMPPPPTIAAPFEQDRFPIPFEEPIFFPLPNRMREEEMRRDTGEPLGWPILISVTLALLTCLAIRAPNVMRRTVNYVGQGLLLCLVAVLGLIGIITISQILPVFALYLGVRFLAKATDRLLYAAAQSVSRSIEFMGFLLVPSYGPRWLSAKEPIEPAAQAPVAEAPVAWQGDRPLDESWHDDEEGEAPKSLENSRELFLLAAFSRVRVLRADLEAKTAELAELEDQLRLLAELDNE